MLGFLRVCLGTGVIGLLLLAATLAHAESRFALVIGNSNYQAAGSLKNADNDAELIAANFKAVGFETQLLIDLDEEALGAALDNLAQRADSLDVVAFYYAGHAIQKDGQNYIIPVDARIETETAIERETIALQSFMKVLDRVPVSLLFLDACRNNPFAEKISRGLKSTSRSTSVQQGLAVVRPIGDMLITFATLPNAVALDGTGDNSPFAISLARHMKTPNVEISVLMKRVTKGVVEQTNGSQRPQQLSQMQTEFYFIKNDADEVVRDTAKSVLSVYPEKVTTGEEIAVVADVPNACLPAFFNMSDGGKVTPVPRKFFKQIILNNGQSRYEISPGSRYGLIVEKSDPRGSHSLGYFCEPPNLQRAGKIALLKALKKKIDAGDFQGNVKTENLDDTLFHFQRYVIH